MQFVFYLLIVLIALTSKRGNNFIEAKTAVEEATDVYTDQEKEPTSYNFEKTSRRNGAKLMKSNYSDTYGRVAGGRKSNTPILFPYQVTLKSIEFGYKHFCGGAIYNEDTIISAAHCFFEDSKSQIPITDVIVVAGEHNLLEISKLEQNRTVKSVVFYHDYRLYPGYNDIAILKLSSPLTFNLRIYSIRIPNENEEPMGRARVSGWGYSLHADIHDQLKSKGYPQVLHYVDLDVIDRETCIKQHQHHALGHAKHTRIFCAGAPRNRSGMDSCEGDSGGPLACLDRERSLYLCGIVQAGFGCGTHLPSFYTKVNQFIQFILKHGGTQPKYNLFHQFLPGMFGAFLRAPPTN